MNPEIMFVGSLNSGWRSDGIVFFFFRFDGDQPRPDVVVVCLVCLGQQSEVLKQASQCWIPCSG